MANKKQAEKYIRQTTTRSVKNRSVRSRLKTLAKKLTTSKEDVENVRKIATEYISSLDKATKKGIIHRNKARRHQSKASLHIQKLDRN